MSTNMCNLQTLIEMFPKIEKETIQYFYERKGLQNTVHFLLQFHTELKILNGYQILLVLPPLKNQYDVFQCGIFSWKYTIYPNHKTVQLRLDKLFLDYIPSESFLNYLIIKIQLRFPTINQLQTYFFTGSFKKFLYHPINIQITNQDLNQKIELRMNILIPNYICNIFTIQDFLNHNNSFGFCNISDNNMLTRPRYQFSSLHSIQDIQMTLATLLRETNDFTLFAITKNEHTNYSKVYRLNGNDLLLFCHSRYYNNDSNSNSKSESDSNSDSNSDNDGDSDSDSDSNSESDYSNNDSDSNSDNNRDSNSDSNSNSNSENNSTSDEDFYDTNIFHDRYAYVFPSSSSSSESDSNDDQDQREYQIQYQYQDQNQQSNPKQKQKQKRKRKRSLIDLSRDYLHKDNFKKVFEYYEKRRQTNIYFFKNDNIIDYHHLKQPGTILPKLFFIKYYDPLVQRLISLGSTYFLEDYFLTDHFNLSHKYKYFYYVEENFNRFKLFSKTEIINKSYSDLHDGDIIIIERQYPNEIKLNYEIIPFLQFAKSKSKSKSKLLLFKQQTIEESLHYYVPKVNLTLTLVDKDSFVARNLTCGICLEIIENPRMIVPCTHHFCSKCLEKCLLMNSSCPTCRATIESTHTSLLASQLLTDAIYYCPNSNCSALGNKSTILEHLQKECDESMVICLQKNCLLYNGDLITKKEFNKNHKCYCWL